MSEPYIRFWASDIRSDPKMAELGLAGQALLAHAWDIAKNGPACPDLRNPSGKRLTSGQFSELIPNASRSQCVRFFEQILRLNLAEKTEDGAITFPSMPRRQGIDMRATERQRRRRLRLKQEATGQIIVTPDVTPLVTPMSRPRHGDVTGQSTDHRTGKKNPSSEGSSSPPPRDRDPIWDAFVETMGPAPETKSGRGGWNKAAKELRDIDAQSELMPSAVTEHRRRWPGIEPTPTSVVKHWTALTSNGNGQPRRVLTAEDFDRLEAERDRILEQRRATATTEEETPY